MFAIHLALLRFQFRVPIRPTYQPNLSARSLGLLDAGAFSGPCKAGRAWLVLESQACDSFPTVCLVIFVGRAPGLGGHLLVWQGSALASQGDTGVVLRGRYRGMVARVTKLHRYWAPPLLAGCSPGPALGHVNQVLAASLCTRGKAGPHTTLSQIALRSPDQTNLSGILIRSLCSVSLSDLSITLHCPTLLPRITTYSTS